MTKPNLSAADVLTLLAVAAVWHVIAEGTISGFDARVGFTMPTALILLAMWRG